LTANAIGGERDRCLKVGCDDYMTKPIEIGSFLNLVARYLPDANFGGGSPSGKHALHSTSADARLESQFAGDPEMADVLARFLERLRSHGVPELRAACTAMDRTLLKRLAHQLNGAGGGYGFPAISVAAGELEDAVRREAASPEVAKRAEILSQLCDRAVSSRVS
jgi:HPt (histidine-containing phosphotransfer) domain-containing protein